MATKTQLQPSKSKPAFQIFPKGKFPDGIKVRKSGAALSYYCLYCKCSLNSESSILNHVNGYRHGENKKFSKTGEGKFISATHSRHSNKSPPKSLLMNHIEEITEPVIGLNYIVELQIPDSEPKYQCSLCEITRPSNLILQHIVSNKHRLNYLKSVNEEEFNEMKKSGTLDQSKVIAAHALQLERERGRGSIEVKKIATEIFSKKNPSNIYNQPNKTESRKRPRNTYPAIKRESYLDDSFNKKHFHRNYSNEFGTNNQMFNVNNLEMPYPINQSSTVRLPDFQDFIGPSMGSYVGSSKQDFIGPSMGSYFGSSKQDIQNNISFEIAALKHLDNYHISNEKDAKVVTESIKTLTESLIEYKLRNLPAPVRELIIKSMNNEGMKTENVLEIPGLTEMKKMDSILSNYERERDSKRFNYDNDSNRYSYDKDSNRYFDSEMNRYNEPLQPDNSFSQVTNTGRNNNMRKSEPLLGRYNEPHLSNQNSFTNSMLANNEPGSYNFNDDFRQPNNDFDGHKSFKGGYNDNNFNESFQSQFNAGGPSGFNRNEIQNSSCADDSYRGYSRYESPYKDESSHAYRNF